ncbi:MAG: putative 4-hydroxybenzoate polyprenyltransferase [Alistipes sp.]|nr:putative 4-hydroxybenzoate polyprenyltransferase [Alistipes sp.]
MNTISKYLSLVKFAHTIFAMPFAMIGFTYAVSTLPEAAADSAPWHYRWLPLLVQVVLCMVFARNVAFGFNRWADRDIDAANPRTADRDIPAGRITPRAAMIFVVINAALFIVTAASINTLTAALSPVALAVVLVYSLCKRFTSMAHLVLGLSLGIAPVGAYIAVTGEFAAAPCVLAVLVMTWCAGFDIIYALQDAEFDRRAGLHSIPARFTAAQALGISTALHAASIAALVWFASFCPGSWLLWTGCALFTAILVAEHMFVTPTRQRHIGIAFGTLNGLASLTLAAFVIADLLLS